MALKKRYKILLFFAALLVLLLIIFVIMVKQTPPTIEDKSALDIPRVKVSDTHYTIGNNWLKKNEYGLWEMYVEGDPFERGVFIGHLSQELVEYQEQAFYNGIFKIVQSKRVINMLKYLVAWQNKGLTDYIPDEFQEEIYGVSIFESDKFDFIGPKYHRKLMYHAAHDIGHTVQNMGLVGCSGFSVWGDKTVDGSIISGRNFDFNVGDEFNKNKLLLFMRPAKGYPFLSYSWPGMSGVVSGINQAGLTVSLNAGPPELPTDSKMPVSILARQILQYADDIESAVAYARASSTFVSESFLINSAKDKRSVIIEKSPESFEVIEGSNSVVCTNHFQAPGFSDNESNLNFQNESSTMRRYDRLTTLINADTTKISAQMAAEFLRDQQSDSTQPHGMGNEEVINALAAHHSIIFKPESKEVWVSTGFNPMDAFVHYNLDSIFSENGAKEHSLSSEPIIPPSPWANSSSRAQYEKYHLAFVKIQDKLLEEKNIEKKEFDTMISYNPDHYEGYMVAGLYYAEKEDCTLANTYFKTSKSKLIPWQKDINTIDSSIKKCKS